MRKFILILMVSGMAPLSSSHADSMFYNYFSTFLYESSISPQRMDDLHGCFPSTLQAHDLHECINDISEDFCTSHFDQNQNGGDACLNQIHVTMMYDLVFEKQKQMKRDIDETQSILASIADSLEKIDKHTGILNKDFFNSLDLYDLYKMEVLEMYAFTFDYMNQQGYGEESFKKNEAEFRELIWGELHTRYANLMVAVSESEIDLNYIVAKVGSSQTELREKCSDRSIKEVLTGFQIHRNLKDSSIKKFKEPLRRIPGFQDFNKDFASAYREYARRMY